MEKFFKSSFFASCDLLDERRVEVVHFTAGAEGAAQQPHNEASGQEGEREVQIVEPQKPSELISPLKSSRSFIIVITMILIRMLIRM